MTFSDEQLLFCQYWQPTAKNKMLKSKKLGAAWTPRGVALEFSILALECNVEGKNQNVMNVDGFHQKILGALAGLAIPNQVYNMIQSLEFTFFLSSV